MVSDSHGNSYQSKGSCPALSSMADAGAIKVSKSRPRAFSVMLPSLPGGVLSTRDSTGGNGFSPTGRLSGRVSLEIVSFQGENEYYGSSDD